MAEIAGHDIQTLIYESANSLVYRSKRISDGAPVILKVLKEDYPSPEELTRYRQEYEITRSLGLPGIVGVYGQEKHQNTLVMFLEDFGGESLRILTKDKPLPLLKFLDYAIKTSEALGAIHERNIIHKDINPANIVVNPQSGLLKIIDFGISTRLSRENRTISNPKALEGTLAYMSPEQTGRMNCPMDYRTDFYSLGAALYEIITGQLPFTTADPLELVHQHLVREPEAPHHISEQTPEALSRIILRLLAKRPEDRYQSAWGIAADLKNCLDQLNQSGAITPFETGQGDLSQRFEIPRKLYGREAELTTLLDAFDRLGDNKSMMLVGGYSGIGKTALVQELHRPITARRGFFISGKYDQFQRETPYSALTAAFRDLVRQLLTEDPVQLEQWKRKLLTNLGPNGQIMIDVIPELAYIIGVQGAVPELGPLESTNRFNLTFLNFLNTFSRPEHPLVVFLDDLQWVDAASLAMIELILTDESVSNLFLIGAYRDNEVDGVHPLMLAKNRLQGSGVTIQDIALGPLAPQHLSRLVADALRRDESDIQPLAQLTTEKTGGNPFFVNQFLETLYQNELIVFKTGDQGHKIWQWDQAGIQAMGITDNVVDLVIAKLRKLPKTAQRVLRLAACVGNRFDLHTLATIYEQSPGETYDHLLLPIDEGLILPQSNVETLGDDPVESKLVILNFKFLHDRIQQAAYALIDDAAKGQVHYKIGRLLYDRMSADERENRVFELVDHLNLGLKHAQDSEEQLTLARLNLSSGQKAMGSTAYAASVDYLKQGIDLLGSDGWDQQYELMSTLHFDLARAVYLNGDLEEAGQIKDRALLGARSDLEKVRIHRLSAVQTSTIGKYAEALDSGRAAFKILGVALAEENIEQVTQTNLAQARANLKGRDVPALIDAPQMTDPKLIAEMGMLEDLIGVVFLSRPDLFPIVALKMVNLSLKNGHTSSSAMGYAAYTIFLSGIQEYAESEAYGKLAISLAAKYKDGTQLCQTIFNYYTFTHHWRGPISEGFEVYDRGYQAGLDAGNLNWSGYCMNYKNTHKFYAGKPLPKLVSEDIDNALKFLERKAIYIAHDILTATWWTASALLGAVKDLDWLSSEEGQKYEKTSMDHVSVIAVFNARTLQSQLLYLFGQYEKALEYSTKALEILPYAGSTYIIAEHCFYQSLTLLHLLGQKEPDQRNAEQLQTLQTNLQQMEKWAKNCPANFEHKYQLMRAETARIEGRGIEAADAYEAAAQAARAGEFNQDEALANELAARFWLARDNPKIGAVYLRAAHQAYRNWGAARKVDDLESNYPQFLAGAAKPRKTQTLTTTTTSAGSGIDLAAVIQASKAIREEIDLNGLLNRILRIALEYSGAERGFLVLHRDGNLIVKARGGLSEEVSRLSVDLDDCPDLSARIVQYAARTTEPVVLDDAAQEGMFTSDAYIAANQSKSILCTPLLNQGSLIAIVFLENNKIARAFTSDRLEILQLLMTPAAVAVENALFKQNEAGSDFEYQVGGSLPGGAVSYVTRKADRELQQLIDKGEFCFVLNPRQMGKSSLRVHTISHLTAHNVRCVAIDLTMIGSDRTTPEQWYAGLARAIISGLALQGQINLRSWWRENGDITPSQRLGELIQTTLDHVTDPIAIFIDEIDSVLSLPFRTDDFFAMIRAFFNKRAEDPRFQRFTFILLGVASPGDLIRDKQRTPFNIGSSVTLTGFHPAEVKPLYSGLADKGADPEQILQSVLAWTGGQPFLTQKACHILRNAETRPQKDNVTTWVGKIIRREIITNWEAHDNPEHLKTIQDRILTSPNKQQLLDLYKNILESGQTPDAQSPIHRELQLTGLAAPRWGNLEPTNAIYREVFDQTWIKKHS